MVTSTMKHAMVLLVLFSLISNPSFSWPWSSESTNDALINRKNDLKNTYTVFTDDGTKLQEKINDGKNVLSAFKEAIKSAKEKNVEFRKVYQAWELVGKKQEEVFGKLKALTNSTDEYFTAAYNHAKTITNEALRKDAENRIKASQDKYNERLKATKEKIELVMVLKNSVDNTMKYLEIVESLKEIEEKVNATFDEIDKLIVTLIAELNNLKDASNTLLNSTLAETK